MAITFDVTANISGLQQGTQQVSAQVSKMAADVDTSFKRMEGQTSSSTQRMTQGLNRLADETTRMTVVQANLDKAFIQTGQAATTQIRAFDRLHQQYQQTNSQSAVMSRGLQQLAQQTVRNTVVQGNLAKAHLHTGQAAVTQATAMQRLHQQYQQTNSQTAVMRRGLEQLAKDTIRNTVVQGNLGKAHLQTGDAFRTLGKDAGAVQPAVRGVTEGLQSLTNASLALFTAFQSAKIFTGLIQDIALTTARTETLGVVLIQVARNAGVEATAATAARDAIKALGITTQEASTVATRFIQNQLSLTDAITLARLAQDAAVIANQNSSQALGGLLHGILTLQPEVLRTYGITVSLESAYKAFAKATGTTTEALTGQQKQQIAMNEVLKAGQAITGTYIAAMDTVGKQISSLSRHFEESANVAGRTYQPALSSIVTTITKLLQGFQALPPGLQNVSAALAASAIAVTGLSTAFVALRTAMLALGAGALLNPWVAGTLAAIAVIGTAVIALTGHFGRLKEAQAAAARGDFGPVIAQSTAAIDERMAALQQSIKAQQQFIESRQGTPAGDIANENAIKRVKEMTTALEALQKTREQLTTRQQPVPPVVDEAAAKRKADLEYIWTLKQTPAAIMAAISEIDRQLAIVKSKDVTILTEYGLDPSKPEFEQKLGAATKRLTDERQKLNDQLLGIDRKAGTKAAGIAGNVAAERAREELAAIESGLARQAQATKIGADQRRQQLDQELSERLTREPQAYAEIEREAQRRRREIAGEEARTLFQQEVAGIERIRDQRLAVLDAEISGAGKNRVQVATFERQKVEAVEDASAKMEQSRARLAEAEQGLSHKTLDVRLEDIKREVEAVEQGAQDVLASRLRIMAAEAQLLETQLASQTGEQAKQTQTQLDQIRAKSFEARVEQIRKETSVAAEEATKQIKNGERLAERLNQINEDGLNEQQALRLEQQDREQKLVNEQLDRQREMWENFGESVENSLGRTLFDGLKGNIKSLADIWNRTLDFMLETFANFVAAIVTQKIIVPIAMGAVGAFGGSLLGGGAGGGGGLMDLLGLAGVANQSMSLFGPTSAIGGALGSLTYSLDSAALSVAQLFGVNGVTQSLYDSMAGLSAQAGLTPVSGLGALAGLAGIGGGIYAATTASGIGGMTGGAIGAAGGAAALLGSLGIGTSLIPGLQPIGLALAALAPLLGSLIDSLGAEKGPRFTLGELEGLDVVVENGMLQVAGTLSSAVGKAERLPSGQSADKIQNALESGLQQAVDTMVNTINAVALDPEALLIPTQEALDTALQNAMTINSASAENFAKDIAAQTLAVVTSIAVSFLGPLGDALQQVFDTDLDQQLKQLPQALTLATQQLQKLVDAVTAIEDTGQSDASNVLPQLKDQINAFRKRIIDNTVDTLNEAFTGGVEDFQEALQLAVSLPQGVIALHAPLGNVQAIAQGVLAMENSLVQAIDGITTAMTPLSTQMQDFRDRFVELQQEIAEAGNNIAVVLPLYAEMQQAIQAEANLRIQQVQAIGGTLASIEQSLFGQLSPAEQQTQLLADIAGLEAELATQTGSEAAGTAAELAALNQQLLAMGESTDNLLMTQTAIENLEALQPILEQQLIALGGTTDVQEAIRNIQQQSLDTLKSMEEDLYNLFLSNTQVQHALNLGPVPVVVVGQAAQQGGIIGYARGGLVPAMLEPGEAVLPPMNMVQQRAMMSMNAAFPRFGGGGIVPGYGSGDTVPAFLSSRSGVLNRNAARAMSGGQGYQTGGTVSSRESTPPRQMTVHLHITNPVVRSEDDIRNIARQVTNELRRYDQRVIRGQR